MSKTLVAYFSASGVTAKLANTLAEAIDADLFEIKPEVPYTSADLDWMNKKSRSSVEMNDLSGKTILPFATSGGSGMGETNENLVSSCDGAKLLEGKVWKTNATKEELAQWVNSLV